MRPERNLPLGHNSLLLHGRGSFPGPASQAGLDYSVRNKAGGGGVKVVSFRTRARFFGLFSAREHA